jgi:hypothetical protein
MFFVLNRTDAILIMTYVILCLADAISMFLILNRSEATLNCISAILNSPYAIINVMYVAGHNNELFRRHIQYDLRYIEGIILNSLYVTRTLFQCHMLYSIVQTPF